MSKSNDQSPDTTIEIFLIEDNPADVSMIRRLLDQSVIRFNLHKIMTGDRAEEILLAKDFPDNGTDVPRPDLILLDLNLPGVDGRELLEKFKRNDTLKSIPVIILTTSDLESDVKKAYAIGANTYLVKPETRDQFSNVVDTLESYWFEIAELPDRP